MNEHPDPYDQQQDHRCEDAPAAFLDPFAVARGFLAVALERCEPTGDAALEVCAAWAELEELGTPAEQVDADIPGVFPPDVILGVARNVLHAAIFTVIPTRRVFAAAFAIRHLDLAVAYLTAGSGRRGGRVS